MSTVIKLGGVHDSRVVTAFAQDSVDQPADAASADLYQDELDRLHALLVERDRSLDEIEARIEKARIDGEAAGRAAAELEAEDNREQALAVLRQGIEQAQEALADGCERMELLALWIARTALEKLFGDDPGRKEAVKALIMRQLRSIERQTLLKIEVSRLDFPDTRELAALAAEIGTDEKLLSANAGFPAGGCRVQLRVGTLEIGIDQQWGAIRGLLDQLAETEEVQV